MTHTPEASEAEQADAKATRVTKRHLRRVYRMWAREEIGSIYVIEALADYLGER